MKLKIPRLYDSHTHFLATGELASGLNLHSLENATDLKNWNFKKNNYFRGHWLVGFGWQDRNWQTKPHKEILDFIFPDFPVYFAKADGHSAWLNSQALKELGLQSANGIILETEHLAAWEKLPGFSESQQRENILAACQIYNTAGFTHVRDMTGSESLWNSLVALEELNKLTVAIEENFTCHDLNSFPQHLDLALYTRKHQTALVRSKGVKFFYDGSLGSETAYLSQPYNRVPEGRRGKALWAIEDVEEIFKQVWQAGLEISVHTIGDQAAHEIVSLARKVSAQGFVGRLNLEHVQVLRPETIQMMKPLHVRCHMQPCHWLSDKVWLKEKLADLYRYAFPWEALRAAQIPISFGCDSPVEAPSFFANQRAINESPQERIKKLTGKTEDFHSHPDSQYGADSFTLIGEDKVEEVIFCGKKINLNYSQ